MPPVIALEDVDSLLATQFTSPIEALAPLPGGNVARIFSFETAGRAYVIRFNPVGPLDFGKEARIIDLLSGSGVPIPAMVAHGAGIPGVTWAISERASGQRTNLLAPAAFEAIIPEMIAMLDRIHAVPVTTRARGYGYFDATLTARDASWGAHLRAVRDDLPDSYYPTWERSFAETRLERDVIDALHAELVRPAALCPDERWLIHGDYGFDNILVEDGRITAVLDWLGARFGDFLYDIAWLDFWSDLDFADRFRRSSAQSGRDIPRFDERLRACKIAIAIDALRFFAHESKTQPDGYDWVHPRALALLAR